jgi:hypothetical protein
MIITNQDRDLSVNLSTKDIKIRPHFVFSHFRIMFFGWNLYGKGNLLGTFDSLQACRITKAEIKQHEKAGIKKYYVSEESDSLEDLDYEMDD